MENNVISYLNAMHQAKLMFLQGIISYKDYMKVEDKMAKKYKLKKLSLYRQNDLIKSEIRAITMIPKQEED